MNPPSSGGNQRFFDRVPYAAELLVVHEREAWRTDSTAVRPVSASVTVWPRDCSRRFG